MVPEACVNDVLRTLTYIWSEFISGRIAAGRRRTGCDRQIVMISRVVAPPKLVDVTVGSRVDNMLCSLRRENVTHRASSSQWRASPIGQVVMLPSVFIIPPKLVDVTIGP